MKTNTNQSLPGYVSLDEIGRGAAYVLKERQGEHLSVHGGVRSLITRAEDTQGTLALTMNSGDAAPATVPHYHNHTTEFIYGVEGITRVWLDDTTGTRFARDLHPGDFVLLPIGWIHAWAFTTSNTRYLAGIAPAGFEKILYLLNPNEPTSLELLRETEKQIDVVWTPDYPLFDEDDEPFVPPMLRRVRTERDARTMGS
jgi:quercetin dioxygenase-like cupin family protein